MCVGRASNTAKSESSGMVLGADRAERVPATRLQTRARVRASHEYAGDLVDPPDLRADLHSARRHGKSPRRFEGPVGHTAGVQRQPAKRIAGLVSTGNG